jgi:hypothetical protein
MSVVSVVVKALLAFGNREEIVITASRANIEEVRSSLTSLNTFTKQTLVVPVVAEIFVFVRHSSFV